MNLVDRLGLEVPLLQAGFAGGMAGPELAAAVSRAGGLGTIGLVAPRDLAAAIGRARALAPRRPIAANLLLPFATDRHVRACVEARPSAVVLFFGFVPRAVRELKAAGIVVIHQVGTAEQARRAIADGADAVIAQGSDAGGHLLGTAKASVALADVRAVAGDVPVLVAGGIADRSDVASALAAGAAGVVCGTRFLATEEAFAHAAYKQRVVGAEETLETTLFGVGWPARHRVLPNAATKRWCDARGQPPLHVRLVQQTSRPLARLASMGAADRLPRPTLAIPLYSPLAPRPDADVRDLDTSALYAGESSRRVRRIVGAEDAVRDLFRG